MTSPIARLGAFWLLMIAVSLMPAGTSWGGNAGAALAAGTAGCGLTPLAAPGADYTDTVIISGATRTYLVHVPADYQNTQPAGLVLNLPGEGESARGHEYVTGMSAAADARNVVVVYPQASGAPARWNTSPAVNGVYPGVQDNTFLRTVILTLQSQMCIDPNLVDMTGLSNGASMAFRVACDDSDLVAAWADVSGYPYQYPCAPSIGEPLIAFHGTADPVIPYNGFGPFTASVPQLIATFATTTTIPGITTTVNDCLNQTTTIYSNTSGVSAIQYAVGCRDNAPVQFYTISGGGHTWPGGTYAHGTGRLGPVNTSISATNLMLDFFAQHPHP